MKIINITMLFLLINITFLIPVSAYNWSSDSNITSGLVYIDAFSAPSIFLDGSTLKLISGLEYGFVGYYWSGSSWISDSSIVSGLSQSIAYSKPTVFFDDSTLKLISGTYGGEFHGYYWSGSSWIYDSNIVSGLGGVADHSAPHVFLDGSILKLISGAHLGGFVGFYWSGSSWISDSSIVSGLGDIGSVSTPSVFPDNNTFRLIAGEWYGGIKGYEWSGSTWIYNSSIITGLSSGGGANPEVYFDNNILNIIIGNKNGGFAGFTTTPIIIPITESFIQFEDTPYNEYDNAIVNFSVQKIMEDYPDKRIYLEIGTPKITDPYYNYAAYELSDYTGYRGLAIEGKHPTYNAFHNCSAYIRAYDQDMGDYETLLEIEQSVLWDNHTLINYTGYDYPTNKSYITGQNIGLLVDIMEYIETDFLGYPDELFTVWVKGFSNSNQGNTEQSFDLDTIYWDADRYFIKHIECAPFNIIDSDFNATVESYVSVYRNGNTTRLTPTVYTNMYGEAYIPEGEEGYEPPEIPEEPEDPDTGENETLPENPDIPDIPTVTNQSINLTWVYYYYGGVNNSFDTLFAPVYNFTGYTLTPIYLLNDSISDYNYIMNESFNETTQKINILSGSFNIIYNSFHPKIVGVITYYLIWLVLLIILKKR